MHSFNMNPSVFSGEASAETIELIETLFDFSISELIMAFDTWLKENNFPCNASDFGFNIQ